MTYQTTINVEAVQWTGDNLSDVRKLFGKYLNDINDISGWLYLSSPLLSKRAFVNDWIILNPKSTDDILDDFEIYTDPDFQDKFHPVTQDHLEL